MRSIILLLLFSCMSRNTNFYEKVLNDFRDQSYFLALNIKTSEYSGPVVIANADLYLFLQKTKDMDKIQYQREMTQRLVDKAVFDWGDIELKDWGFMKVSNAAIKEQQSLSVDDFLQKYFDNAKVLKDGISDSDRSMIIYKLFQWEIASKVDDETGYLVISR